MRRDWDHELEEERQALAAQLAERKAADLRRREEEARAAKVRDRAEVRERADCRAAAERHLAALPVDSILTKGL